MASQKHTERDYLTCSICLEILKEPKTLTCMHRFCESCLHTHIISSVKSSSYSVRSFSCPLCRISISVPNYLTPPSTWASQFRTDFDVKGLIELVQSRKELPETNVPKIKYPACSKHTDKECGFYCMDCGQTCCETCAVISHRACNQMVTVEDAAKARRTALRSQINDISSKIGQAVELESLREDCMRNIEDTKGQIEQKIIEFAHKLHQLVSSEEEKLLKHLEKKYDGLQEKVSLTVSNFEETINNARSAVKNASSKTFSSDFDLICDHSCVDALASCDITNATAEHTRFCKKLSEVKCFYKKDSVPDITLGKCSIFYDLSDHDISANSKSAASDGGSSANLSTSTVLPRNQDKFSYATVLRETSGKEWRSRAPNEALLTSRTGDKAKEEFPIMEHRNNTASTVIRTIKTRLRQDNQKPCLNSLIVVAPNDTVLATDWANKSVKAFPNKRGHKNSSLTIDCHPWAITQVSDSSAAVSLPSSQHICFIKVSPVLTIDRYIKVSKSYQGLASFISLDSVIIVAGSSQNSARNVASIDLLTNTGQVLKSFTQDSSGLPLFSDPAYLCVTEDKMIVVSDVGHKTVKYVTLDGEPKFSYPPEGAEPLQNPKGVTCDPSGGIVVVEGGDLLALTSDGQLKKTLISSKDRSLCISGAVAVDKGGRLYVVDNEEHIQVFRCDLL